MFSGCINENALEPIVLGAVVVVFVFALFFNVQWVNTRWSF